MSGWKFNSKIPAVLNVTDDGARAGLRALADAELELSNSKVPTDTGELKRSGRVTEAGGDKLSVVYDAAHAAIVHERMDLAHDDGQAKFLELAMAELARSGGRIVADEMKRRLR